jgi:two-component system cell cycle sensor histidine kinase/response regulator CckA
MEPKRIKRLGQAALILSLTTLVALTVGSLFEWRQFNRTAELVATTRQVLKANQVLLTDLDDAETGQRGYLLTGQLHYLEPYTTATREIPNDLADLAAGAQGQPEIASRVATLSDLTRQKLRELRLSIELQNAKGPKAALELLGTDLGKRMMGRIREVSARVGSDEEDRRERAWSELNRQALFTRWLALAGALFLAGLIGLGAMMLGRAVEEQERLTGAAADARDLLHTTLYSIGDAVIASDGNGAVSMMNPVAERLTGYPEKDALRLPAEKVFHIVNEATRKEVESPVRRVLRDGCVVGLANHTVLIDRAGRDVPVDDSGAPIRDRGGNVNGVVLVFRDVSERKKSEEALRESERRFRMVADSAPVMIWSETPNGMREYFNRPWLDFRGRSAEQESGEAWKEGIHPEDLARHESLLAAVFRSREPFSLEYRLRRADGQYCWVLSRGVPRFGDRGEFLGYIGTCIDIEESKRTEEKVRQAAKLESLGVLAGGIAHDFNNLLVGILGGASLLEDYVPEDSPARELVDGMQRAGERAASLVKQILAYSGHGRFVVEPLDLSHEVREIASLITASIPKNVTLKFALAEGLPPVEADGAQLQQIVMNLVINAAEAAELKGGWVQISTEEREIGPGEVAGAAGSEPLAPGPYLVLRVADNGCGMDAETRARIFDPFFTTKFTGRGLGLAAALGIVRGHHGAITVESDPGGGAVFEVFLPAVKASAPEPGPPDSASFSGSGKILVVDDEEVVRRVAETALTRMGFEVLQAASGNEAVEVFQREAGAARLIVLDMNMPGISGEETIGELRRARPEVPIIVSSGYTETEAIERFGDTIQGFLHKPYQVPDLARAVQAALGKSRAGSGTA